MSLDTRHFDLIVIGAGPGGYVAALRASACGLSTALIERERVGGICLNWGCIPTKALIRSAQVLRAMQNARRFGLSNDHVAADYAAVQRRSRQTAERLGHGIQQLLARAKVETIAGSARLAGRSGNDVRVEVALRDGSGDIALTAPRVIVATGGRSRELPHVPFDGVRIIASKEALELTVVPPRMIIVGGGVVGLEFADIFSTFGAKVNLVEITSRILPAEDAEVSEALHIALAKRGVHFHTSTTVRAVTLQDDGVHAQIVPASGDGPAEELVADCMLVAVGVVGNVEDVGLETVGIVPRHSYIQVDQHLRTSADGIYAIGDVIGPPLLAHLASGEGIHAAEHAAGRELPDMDRDWIPAVVFTQPQVATVGMSEIAAKAAGLNPRVGHFPFSASGKGMADGEMAGFVKVVLDEAGDRLLGAQIVGREAGELIAELTVIGLSGTSVRTVLRSLHAHPTFSEAIPEALRAALGEPLHI